MEVKAKHRRNKSKLLESKKMLLAEKRSLTTSQESIINPSSHRKRDFLKNLRKNSKFGSMSIQRGDIARSKD